MTEARAAGRSLFAPLEADGGALDDAVVEEAAAWLVRLQFDDSEANRVACSQWRQAHPSHELAWRRFGALRADVSSGVQNAPAQIAGRALHAVSNQAARRRSLKWMVGLGGAGILSWAARDYALQLGWMADYRSGTGEQRAFELADGTRIMMNAGSALDVAYSDSQRLLLFRGGEILVQTGADSLHRPLSIRTSQGLVRPVGTRFVLRQLGGTDTPVSVVVIEGMVALRPAQAPENETLVPTGQQALLSAQTATPPEPADIDAAQAWQQGMLLANRMRLDAFLAELSRYRPGRLLADPAVAGRLVTGAFRIDDTDKALQALASGFDLKLNYRTRYWVRIEPNV